MTWVLLDTVSNLTDKAQMDILQSSLRHSKSQSRSSTKHQRRLQKAATATAAALSFHCSCISDYAAINGFSISTSRLIESWYDSCSDLSTMAISEALAGGDDDGNDGGFGGVVVGLGVASSV
jgi:hypothetical protein